MSIFYDDLSEIAKSIPETFYNSTIFVTGGTGLIGSILIKGILFANKTTNSNITVVSLVRSLEKAKEVFENDYQNDKLNFICGDILTKIDCDYKIDYIIHGASPTASKTFVTNPVETIMAAVTGTKNMLDFGKDKSVKGFVYLSSMEVFGQCNNAEKRITEEELGYIDIHNIRSCYSEGKRLCECLCTSYAHEYNMNVTIARLAQVFGAGILKTEGRVFSQFARSAINRQDIVLHTDGTSWGNYCYTTDAISAIFKILEKGLSGNAYTVVNEETSNRIKDIAQMVSTEFGDNKIKVIFDIPEDAKTYGYAPATTLKLSSSKLQTLGWEPHISLKDAYSRLIEYMKSW